MFSLEQIEVMTVAFFKQGINERGFMAGVDAVWLFLQRIGVFLLVVSIILLIIALFTFDPRKELLRIYADAQLKKAIENNNNSDEPVETFVRNHTEKYIPPSKVGVASLVNNVFRQ